MTKGGGKRTRAALLMISINHNISNLFDLAAIHIPATRRRGKQGNGEHILQGDFPASLALSALSQWAETKFLKRTTTDKNGLYYYLCQGLGKPTEYSFDVLYFNRR